MPRPDQSYYLAHFTKNGDAYDFSNPVENPDFSQMSALDRLVKILSDRVIIAKDMSWIKRKAVCFTECPWSSLLKHAKKYSPYGIGFTKKYVYSKGGNPVFYVNPNLFNSQNWSEGVKPFLTPFVPTYAPDEIKKQAPFNGRPIDYTHEREWRVACDFKFSYRNISFIILEKVYDLDKIPKEIIKNIGIEKFVYIDSYRKIEELWPVHIL